MSLPEPIKIAATKLVPPVWQTLVLTPLLLMVIAAGAAYVYAERVTAAKGRAADQTTQAARVTALEGRLLVREAHDEDRDRRMQSLERAIREMQRDLAVALGNPRAAVDAQRKLDEMPPE